MAKSNIQKLGNTLAGQMKRTANGAVPTTLELGRINDNLSLSTDSLRTAIPKGDYMVALHLSGISYRTSQEPAGEPHSHGLPDVFRQLQAGDRVLVAWCGNEPVIISIVVSS